jgi:hypothetical protein
MTQPSGDLWGAAIHEAGHVLVALAYGLPIGWIEIRDDGGGSAEPLSDDERLPVRDRIAVWLSGGLAQEYFKAPSKWYASADDYARVINATSRMTDAERQPLIDDGKARASKIILQTGTEIQRLAKILMKRRRINLGDVQPPIRTKSPELIAYAREILARKNEGFFVPYRQVGMDGETPNEHWKPAPNRCHANVAAWVARCPQDQPVYGYLLLLPPDYATTQVLAHAVVQFSDGSLADITPHGERCLFVPHKGPLERFEELREAIFVDVG